MSVATVLKAAVPAPVVTPVRLASAATTAPITAPVAAEAPLRANSSNDGDDRLTLGVEVLSGEGGEFALPAELRLLACYLADGHLLVSRSHRSEPRLTAYAARLERLGRTVRPVYVELAAIQRAYVASKDRVGVPAGAAAFNATAMQSHAIQLFRRAAQRSASDIHIRVTEGANTQILMRVLGDLAVVEEQSAAFGSALCSAIYQALTDQSDATFVPGHPQDGRISNPKVLPPNVSGLRVATTPQVAGHVMVLRMLYKSSKHGVDLRTLGFSAEQLESFARLRRRTTGIIVNSGPTGAGKSTTLQCALADVLRQAAGRSHVITVEDPPEYPIVGAVQTPVVCGGSEESRALAFQQAIRAAMRLDPDIIMIGEMRDGPSARLAVAAAMTGHQVWTTLHANHAIDIVDRLVDMGVPMERLTNPSVVAGLVAQRLVKSLCPHCSEPFIHAAERARGEVHDNDYRRMGEQLGPLATLAHVKGSGCPQCEGSGYRSRTVLAEIIETSTPFMTRLRAGDREGALALWREQGGLSLMDHARAKVGCALIDPFDAEEQVTWS